MVKLIHNYCDKTETKLKKIHLSLVVILIIFVSYSQQSFSQYRTYGDSSSFAGTIVKSWIETDEYNDPVQIGVTLPKNSLANLPTSYQNISLNLPQVSNDSLFKHIFFNWNPGGHPPNSVYGLPHFDIHYYIITNSERMLIPGGTDNTAVLPQFVPEDYTFIPGEEFVSVPQMGVHYVDSLSSEFQGQTFTATFIYGFSKGKMVFVEPMITSAFLSTAVNELISIKQADEFQKSGFYPTFYKINYNSADETIDIIIRDFVYHTAVTSIYEPKLLTEKFVLEQNYPNPFNPETTLKYSLPEDSRVVLKVYDLLGNEISTLVNENKSAGTYQIILNSANLPSGIYFYQLNAGRFVETRKMIVIK